MRRGLQRYLDEFVYRFDRRWREEALSGFVLRRAMQSRPFPSTVSRVSPSDRQRKAYVARAHPGGNSHGRPAAGSSKHFTVPLIARFRNSNPGAF